MEEFFGVKTKEEIDALVKLASDDLLIKLSQTAEEEIALLKYLLEQAEATYFDKNGVNIEKAISMQKK